MLAYDCQKSKKNCCFARNMFVYSIDNFSLEKNMQIKMGFFSNKEKQKIFKGISITTTITDHKDQISLKKEKRNQKITM